MTSEPAMSDEDRERLRALLYEIDPDGIHVLWNFRVDREKSQVSFTDFDAFNMPGGSEGVATSLTFQLVEMAYERIKYEYFLSDDMSPDTE